MSRGMLFGREIVLGVSGGIAAYKAVYLLRLMVKVGARVRVMMTPNAAHFVGPVTFEAICDRPVCTDLYDRRDPEAAMRHIEWAREARAVVVAPATANLLGKFARGIADDALSTFLTAVTCPVLLCPAMNSDMYLSPAVQRNLDLLRSDGHLVLSPGEGELACGVSGTGRLPEPEQIMDRLESALTRKDLGGRRVLVTAGPTREFLDPVRFISNPSSGRMGFAVARAAEHRGAEVTLVTGPVNLPDPPGMEVVRVTTANEMAEAALGRVADAEIIVKTAAVSDYRPREIAAHKIKKGDAEETLILERNPDILREIGARKGNRFLVGFAAETRDLRENASQKLRKKNLDMIVGNVVTEAGAGFASDDNRVTFFYPDGGQEVLESMPKIAVAHRLLDRVVERMG
ncbi:MAG: bifunctional phosphopantothenoylcysteine decarboxylase/phosphopantothenate--cysteine ligase CoaBC [Desulfococcaceae bacterium]